jgi:CubicO group peptidase (beta-lactamase class C family)
LSTPVWETRAAITRRAALIAAASCAVSASGQGARAQTGARFARAIRFSAERDGVALIIVRNGVIIGEAQHGDDAHHLWPLGAASRLFVALLAASLAEDRLMTLDEPVALTLGDWGADPIRSTISVRSLLSGASGIAFGDTRRRDLAAALALPARAGPGERFINDAAPYVLFEEIARRKLSGSGRDPDPARYLTNRTLAAIGATPIAWTRDASRGVRLDDGVSLSVRGLALAGELIRREGVWRASQLADDTIMREAVRGSFAEPRAGFGLWINARNRGRDDLGFDSDLWRGRSPAPADLVMAAGDGGQRLYVVPSVGLVVARLSRSVSAPWSDAQFLSSLWEDL